MATIIGKGSERDPAALKLYTTSNQSWVENVRPDTDLAPETLLAARKMALGISPTARCRSLTAMYNCVGLVFASRRTQVDAKHLPIILKDDGYRRILESEADFGDVVVYKRDGIAQHVGFEHEVRDISPLLDGSMHQIFVLSQWGENGEYLHKLQEVPFAYGKQFEFWTERRLP